MVNLYKKFLEVFTNKSLYSTIFDKFIAILLIIIISWVCVRICLKLSDYIMNTSLKANNRFGMEINTKRNTTLYKLVRSIIRYTIYFIAFIQILSVLGVNTTGILASAGIVSVAIGFGAQSLVKDIITGFFIIIEGQFDVGEYVRIHNQTAFIAEGTVMSLGIRSTKIRSDGGEVYFIPNSSINQVINYSRNYSQVSISFAIAVTSSFSDLEKEVNNLLFKVNNNNEYQKQFYSEEGLIFKSIDSLEADIANITIVGKVNLGKKTIIENKLRKDFYNEFTSRLVAKES